jgi:hypothetical protein
VSVGVLVDAARGYGDCVILSVHLDSFLSWEGWMSWALESVSFPKPFCL